MEILPYGGWARCARISAGDAELFVTLEVGPRIIRYGQVGGPNQLVEFPDEMGKTGGDEFRSYGGHRLWIAPEEDPKTFYGDNHAVDYREEDGWHVFTAAPEPWHVQKQMRLRVEGEAVRIEHRVYNLGAYVVTFAPWALTVMAPGGVCIFPQSPSIPHSEKVLPARPIVLWNYTDMSDPRWTWGSELVRLAQHTDKGPQKVGAFVEQGWAAYANRGNVFLKRFEAMGDRPHADFGCNFEAFTRQDMLEVESLGPLQGVAPGQYASHWETWYLLTAVTVPDGEDACKTWFEDVVASRPLVK